MKFEHCSKDYYSIDIPSTKRIGANSIIGKIPVSEILVLIDCTVFGSAKDGVVISDRGLHWKNIGTEPNFISWANFPKVSITEKKKFPKEIAFDKQGILSLSGASTISDASNQDIFNLFTCIQKHLLDKIPQKTIDTNRNSRVVSDFGMLDCEFCSKKNKPNVTYCKHCGTKIRG